jgi:hypothetical protein
MFINAMQNLLPTDVSSKNNDYNFVVVIVVVLYVLQHVVVSFFVHSLPVDRQTDGICFVITVKISNFLDKTIEIQTVPQIVSTNFLPPPFFFWLFDSFRHRSRVTLIFFARRPQITIFVSTNATTFAFIQVFHRC